LAWKGIAVPFDDQLRRAFRREEPDPGFAERTMSVIELEARGNGGFRGMRARWLVAAAALLLLVLGGVNALLTHERTLRARQDVEIGLRIAVETLNQVQAKLVDASAKRGAGDAH
jgi:hypothetical protein